MRKLLSVLLVLVLCASMMTLTAFAAENGSMSATSAEVAPGSSATITVSLTSNPGVMAYTVKPSVPEGFSIQMAKAGMDGIWTIGKNAQWDNSEDSTYTGPILTVTVTADAAVEPGTYTISFSAVGANYDEEDVNFGSCTATITVLKPACNHVWDAGKVTKDATCTEDGVKTFTCTVSGCGETKTEVIPATGHKFGEWKVTTEATCTEKGVETRQCACGAAETREIAAKGHTFGEWTETKAPTCTEKGVETRKCACGAAETREIAAKGHTFGEWTETKAPTCTEKGVETRKCACGATETREVAALKHVPAEAVKENVVAATETTDGSYDLVVYCSLCGEELSREKVTVPALGLDDEPNTGDFMPALAMLAVVILMVPCLLVKKFRAVK